MMLRIIILAVTTIVGSSINASAMNEHYNAPETKKLVNKETTEEFYNNPIVKQYYNSMKCGNSTNNKCSKERCIDYGFEWKSHNKCVTPIEKEYVKTCNSLLGRWAKPYRENIISQCSFDDVQNHSDINKWIEKNRHLIHNIEEGKEMDKNQISNLIKTVGKEILKNKVAEEGDYIMRYWKVKACDVSNDNKNDCLKSIAKAYQQTITSNNLAYNLYSEEECQSNNGQWLSVEEANNEYNVSGYNFAVYHGGSCVTPQLTQEQEIQRICEQHNGTWSKWGMEGIPNCTFYYQDAGASCTKNSDCISSACLSIESDKDSGICKTNNNPFGCYKSFNDYGLVGCLN